MLTGINGNLDGCPTLRIFVSLIRTHTLIAILQTQVSSIYRESSFKVRSVSERRMGTLLFFVPIHGRSVRDG